MGKNCARTRIYVFSHTHKWGMVVCLYTKLSFKKETVDNIRTIIVSRAPNEYYIVTANTGSSIRHCNIRVNLYYRERFCVGNRTGECFRTCNFVTIANDFLTRTYSMNTLKHCIA